MHFNFIKKKSKNFKVKKEKYKNKKIILKIVTK